VERKVERAVVAALAITFFLATPMSCEKENNNAAPGWEELNREALALFRQGKIGVAKTQAELALRTAEKESGPESLSAATTLVNLAGIHFSLREYETAHEMYARAEKIQVKELGKESIELAPTFNNHALLLKTVGNRRDAEKLYVNALTIQKKALGPDHPEIGATLNNIAELYKQMGLLDLAEKYYNFALKNYEKAHGKESPRLIPLLENMTHLYQMMGKQDQEGAFQLRLKLIREKADAGQSK